MYPWGNRRRFHSLSDSFRQQYGTRLQKLTVHAGFTCPNRDGTVSAGGCTFCNNEGFSPSYCDPSKPIHVQIEEGLTFVRNRYPRANRFVAYFQTYSNTYAPLPRLKEIYGEALRHPAISGLVIGTRPDCVDEEKLDYLAWLARKYFIKIEYGLESCYDDSLKRVNRGHTFRRSEEAIAMTAKKKLFTGIHLIIGLPGETRSQMLAQVDTINRLPIQAIKLHQLQIVKDTPMAIEYEQNPDAFALFDLEEYVDFVVAFLERLRPDIAIDRFSGEIPPRLITGKRWGMIRSDAVIRMVEDKMNALDTYQGRLK